MERFARYPDNKEFKRTDNGNVYLTLLSDDGEEDDETFKGVHQ